jgi:hypothetical protein
MSQIKQYLCECAVHCQVASISENRSLLFTSMIRRAKLAAQLSSAQLAHGHTLKWKKIYNLGCVMVRNLALSSKKLHPRLKFWRWCGVGLDENAQELNFEFPYLI